MVGAGSDEAAEALAEFEDGLGEHVFAEETGAVGAAEFLAGDLDGVSELREGQAGDDDAAEVVAWDADSARPMLVRNHVGKGTVYTFTAWAYPGHEQLQRFSASWLAYLSAQSLPEPYVLDPSGEVFWTVWESDAECRVLLLNTDWTQPDGVRTVTLVHPGGRVSVDVREGALTEAVLAGKEVAVRSWTLERV